MASTIVTKNSSTASAVPVSGDLTQGELAVNVTDKRLFTKNSGGTVVELGTNPASLALPNGTTNGVAYLNGSKVVTTGTALTFDGTNLGIGTSSPGYKLDVRGSAQNGIYYKSSGNYGAVVADNSSTTGGGAFSAWTNGAQKAAFGTSGWFKGDTSVDATLYAESGAGIQFMTNGSTTAKATIDSSGNLGLGVTPSAWSGYKAFEFSSAGSSVWSSGVADVRIAANQYYNAGYKFAGTGYSSYYQQSAGAHYWYSSTASGTAGNAITFTQAMTLDASGNLLVGDTALTLNSRVYALRNSNGIAFAAKTTTTSDISLYCAYTGTTGTPYFGYWVYNGNVVGSISATASTTSYNTSSDYRLKNTIAPMTGALAKVAQLKPVTYKWNADGSDGEGFIAHELAEVVPQCVTGEKDAVDEEGNPKYQGIDTSFLVATLTAAIQELKAEFDAYKATHP